MKDIFQRFEEKVKINPVTQCWEWQASVHPSGYGRFRLSGKTCKAHRVSYELYVGDIPQGLLVLHSCDNPACVNPLHLRVGTQKDNMADMHSRGRFFSLNRLKKYCPKCGVNSLLMRKQGRGFVSHAAEKLLENGVGRLEKRIDTDMLISLN